jgi:hypothetical protein
VISGQTAVGRLRQRLHDEVLAISIHDERRQQIAFAVDEPIGRRIDLERGAERRRLIEPIPPGGGVGFVGAAREHAQRDFRAIAVERVADDPAAAVNDPDRIAAVGVDLADVRSINPWMAVLHALIAASRQVRGTHAQRL